MLTLAASLPYAVAKESHSHAGTAAIITAALVVGYILSPGIVVLVMQKAFSPGRFGHFEDFLGIFYAPLLFAVEHVPAIETFYDWYFELLGMI